MRVLDSEAITLLSLSLVVVARRPSWKLRVVDQRPISPRLNF